MSKIRVRGDRQRIASPMRVPDTFRPVLQRLEADMARILGLPAVDIEPLYYDERPYSHLLRAAVREPESGAIVSRLFIKRLKTKDDKSEEAIRERVVHEFTTSRRVHDAMQACPDIGAIHPIAHYPDALTLVTEEVQGETLFTYLQRRATGFPSSSALADMTRTMSSIGRWIAMLQDVERHTDAVSFDDIRTYVDVRLVRLVREGRTRFGQGDRTAILEHMDRLAAGIATDDLRRVLVHADLAVGNVMVDDGRIVVLDFAMAHTGTRLHDLTRLHLQLDLLCAKPQFRRAIVTRLQDALRRGFDPTLTVAHPLFRLLTLLHRVNNLATLSIRPSAFPASLYDAHVRRLHRRAIARELRQPVDAAPSQA